VTIVSNIARDDTRISFDLILFKRSLDVSNGVTRVTDISNAAAPIRERRPRPCLACGKPLPVGQGRKYCGPVSCAPRKRPAPVVYRYVCPDGRSYVGSVSNVRYRDSAGLCRCNAWIAKALATYPPETWRFEILEQLPVGCSAEVLLQAEQKHIDLLRSFRPKYGFNVAPALWFGDTPGVKVARARAADRTLVRILKRKVGRRSKAAR
jgi:hypothetical protein